MLKQEAHFTQGKKANKTLSLGKYFYLLRLHYSKFKQIKNKNELVFNRQVSSFNNSHSIP